jgi:hypothetical protein
MSDDKCTQPGQTVRWRAGAHQEWRTGVVEWSGEEPDGPHRTQAIVLVRKPDGLLCFVDAEYVKAVES